MTKDDKNMACGAAIVLLALLAVATVMLAIKAHNEAATFNRLTGGNATAWDALWVDLRVVGVIGEDAPIPTAHTAGIHDPEWTRRLAETYAIQPQPQKD